MKKKIVISFIFICMVQWIQFGATNTANFESYESGGLSIHPVHISVTTIEYMEKEGKFKIQFKLFVDDFELILKLKYGKEIKLQEGRWEKNYLKIINTYLLEHFKLFINGKDKTKSSLKFNKKEIKEQAIWLEYEYNSIVKSDIFNILNSLMTDLYPDQKNLLIFVYKGKEKGLEFNHKMIKQELRF